MPLPTGQSFLVSSTFLESPLMILPPKNLILNTMIQAAMKKTMHILGQ